VVDADILRRRIAVTARDLRALAAIAARLL
jgi:hypothetical protein